LSNIHASSDASTFRRPENGVRACSDHKSGPGLCVQCRGNQGAPPTLHAETNYPLEGVWLHQECVRFWREDHPANPPAQVEQPKPAGTGSAFHDRLLEDWDRTAGPVPDYLKRTRPRLGRPALGPEGDDLGDFE
jgi:hypothetical protein